MLHTNHWKDGDTGRYFYFSNVEFDEMVGNSNWDGKTFDIIQEGSQNWIGKIKVWKADWANKGPQGRREHGSDSGQWKTGDAIKLQECHVSGGGTFICFTNSY